MDMNNSVVITRWGWGYVKKEEFGGLMTHALKFWDLLPVIHHEVHTVLPVYQQDVTMPVSHTVFSVVYYYTLILAILTGEKQLLNFSIMSEV